MTTQKRSDALAKAGKDLMLSQPFYGLTLLNLRKSWSNQVPTAGVTLRGINIEMMFNEDFWDTLTPKQHIGLLWHEILHVCFFHLTDFNHLTDNEVANIAMDIEINQYIIPELLPPNPCLPSLFPELNLEPKKGTKYYYEKLMQAQKDKTCPNLDSLLDQMKAGDKGIVIELPDGTQVMIPDHSQWGDTSNMSEAEVKLIGKQIEHIIKEVTDQVRKSRGTIPGEMTEIIHRIEHVEPAKFDWRGYLRRFSGGSYKVQTKITRRKFNKRINENPGLKIKFKKHLLIGLDTSGSVSTEEVKEFMNEIWHINKTGTEVTIAQFDTAITKIEKFNSREDFQLVGRGGTSFHPIVEYYNDSNRKYDALIIVTDGEAPAPERAKGRMLWVLSSKSNFNESLIGPQIVLN